MSQTRDRLSTFVSQLKMVHLTRRFPGQPTHNGFVLGLGEELVLLQQFHDFYLEGYSALRVVDIKGAGRGERGRFWEKMFRAEGIMELVGIPYDVPLDDFRSVLTALHGRGQHVIVECEDRRTADDDVFLIGRIVSVGDDSVSILHFDSLGNWDPGPTEVAYDDITLLEFDTPYVNTLSKYLKEPPPGHGLNPASARPSCSPNGSRP